MWMNYSLLRPNTLDIFKIPSHLPTSGEASLQQIFPLFSLPRITHFSLSNGSPQSWGRQTTVTKTKHPLLTLLLPISSLFLCSSLWLISMKEMCNPLQLLPCRFLLTPLPRVSWTQHPVEISLQRNTCHLDCEINSSALFASIHRPHYSHGDVAVD